jgi:hypothetical protein
VMNWRALQLVELHLIAGYRTGTFQRPDPPARNNGPGLAIMRRLRALALMTETMLARLMGLSESAGALLRPRVCQVDPRLCAGRLRRNLSYSR